MKSHTRLLAGILLIATVANATGCSAKTKENKGSEVTSIVMETEIISPKEEDIVESITSIQDSSMEIEEIPNAEFSNNEIIQPVTPNVGNESIDVVVIEKSTEEILKECLYDENIDYVFVISTYLNTDYDKRSELENDYLRALYMLLVNSGVSIETYLTELNTMAVMQQIPMCVPEDIWTLQFGNLLNLLNGYESLFEKFGTLAYFVHDLECEQTHTFEEYGSYTCPNLQEDYKLVLKLESKDL